MSTGRPLFSQISGQLIHRSSRRLGFSVLTPTPRLPVRASTGSGLSAEACGPVLDYIRTGLLAGCALALIHDMAHIVCWACMCLFLLACPIVQPSFWQSWQGSRGKICVWLTWVTVMGPHRPRATLKVATTSTDLPPTFHSPSSLVHTIVIYS